jgi:hypothetical protein
MKRLSDVMVGDKVLRWLAGIEVPMPLIVTELTDERIICGPWEFDRITGAEIDELLGWGPKSTGSWICLVSPSPENN